MKAWANLLYERDYEGADEIVVHLMQLVEGEGLWRSFHRELVNIGPEQEEGMLAFYANSWILSGLHGDTVTGRAVLDRGEALFGRLAMNYFVLRETGQ